MKSTSLLAGLMLATCTLTATAAGHGKMHHHAPGKVAEAKPLPPATPQQIEAAERTYFGAYACEFNQTVDVSMNPKAAGYVDVNFKGKTYTMQPVLSSTGALRLEDVTGRTLMVQIATKSMLLDVKAGQRLVDECIHSEQAANAKVVKPS